MSLGRQHNPLGNVIIRQLGDAGGPRSDWVADEINNLITWAKDSPRVIHRDVTVVGNVGAGADTLRSVSVAAASLATDGDALDIYAAGTFAANAHSKSVVTTYGAQGLGADITTTINNGSWKVFYRIARTGATTAVVMADARADDTGSAVSPINFGRINNITVTHANANTFLLTGQDNDGAPVNDSVQIKYSMIILYQQ